MLPCTVIRCGASTVLRCGACGQLPVCSLACAQAAWPEHRSDCVGARARQSDERGEPLPALEPVLHDDAELTVAPEPVEAAPAAAAAAPAPAPAPAPASLEPATSLADFALSASTLGAGNYSVVLRGVHRRSGTAVAVKRVSRAGLRGLARRHPGAAREVLQEKHVGGVLRGAAAAAAAAVMPLLATFSDGDDLCLVYALAAGGELWARACAAQPSAALARPRVPAAAGAAAAAPMLRTLVRALAILHGQGVVHRDLKPENVVLLAAGGEPLAAAASGLRLVDFGTSKDLLVPAFNSAGEFVGTPEYMPPEAADCAGAGGGVPADTAADLWSLGALAYHLMAGATPFKERSAYATLRRVARFDSGHGSERLLFPPGVPAAARDFVCALLRRDRARRLGVVGSAPPPPLGAPPPLLLPDATSHLVAGWARAPSLVPAVVAAAAAHPGAAAPAAAAATLPARFPVIDHDALLRHPFLALGGAAAGDGEAVQCQLRDHAAVDAGVGALCACDAGAAVPPPQLDVLRGSERLWPRVQYAWHALALRRRAHVPAALLACAEAALAGGAQPPARALAVGAARCLRLLAYECSSCAGDGHAGGGGARACGGALVPCRLAHHSPREVIAWNAPQDSGGYVSPAELGAHWAAWHVRGGGRQWGPPPGAADDGDDGVLNERGWRLMRPGDFSCQPHIAAAGAPPAPLGFALACVAHVRMRVGETASLRAWLAAAARCRPQPRALILCGYLSDEYARWHSGGGGGGGSPLCDWSLVRAQLCTLLSVVGEVTLETAGAAHGAAAAPPILFAGAEAIDCLAALLDCAMPAPGCAATDDATARLHSLRAWSRCTGAWLSGTRALFLDADDALTAAAAAAAAAADDKAAPVTAALMTAADLRDDGAAAADADASQRMTWLLAEAELARSSAQHVLAVLRTDPLVRGAGHAPLHRWLGETVGCRAVIVPAPLLAGDGDGRAGDGDVAIMAPPPPPQPAAAAADGALPWLTVPSLRHCAGGSMTSAVRVEIILVGQFEVCATTLHAAPGHAELNVELLLAVLGRGGIAALQEVGA